MSSNIEKEGGLEQHRLIKVQMARKNLSELATCQTLAVQVDGKPKHKHIFINYIN